MKNDNLLKYPITVDFLLDMIDVINKHYKCFRSLNFTGDRSIKIQNLIGEIEKELKEAEAEFHDKEQDEN